MKAQPYHLQISAKTRFFNSLRRFFIISGLDKFLGNYARNNTKKALTAKLVPPNYLYRPDTFRNCNVDGINFRVDVSDTVGHTNYYAIDDKAEKLLFDFVKPGMVVIDIGANIGATTLKLAKRVLPAGKVYSFEPSPYNYQRASENISLNNFPNISLFNQGLGNEKTTAFLYNVNNHNRGMQRILTDNDSAISYDKTAVEIDTLDNSIQQFAIPRPALMKIDVEGFELKVLKGAMATLTRQKPFLFIELDDNNLREQGNNAKELIQFLSGIQYKIINAATGDNVDENTDYTDCHFDILCTPA